MKAIVFGATPSAWEDYDEIKKSYDIVAYCDNDHNKWNTYMDNIKIISPQDIFEYQWDEIIVISLSAMNVIKKQLLDMGVPQNRINTSFIDYKVRARENFVRDFAAIIEARIRGGGMCCRGRCFSRRVC